MRSPGPSLSQPTLGSGVALQTQGQGNSDGIRYWQRGRTSTLDVEAVTANSSRVLPQSEHAGHVEVTPKLRHLIF